MGLNWSWVGFCGITGTSPVHSGSSSSMRRAMYSSISSLMVEYLLAEALSLIICKHEKHPGLSICQSDHQIFSVRIAALMHKRCTEHDLVSSPRGFRGKCCGFGTSLTSSAVTFPSESFSTLHHNQKKYFTFNRLHIDRFLIQIAQKGLSICTKFTCPRRSLSSS